MQTAQIQDLKIGEVFKRKPTAKTTFTRDVFCRSTRKYICIPDDYIWGGGMEMRGTMIVYVGFDY
tara:strand:+ start:440 stop:634 length:195 start_codon:yes stop_codon:yes gene_type:complete